MFEIIALLSIWIGFGTVLKRRREMNETSATLEHTVAGQV
jgi:hypothetical protein